MFIETIKATLPEYRTSDDSQFIVDSIKRLNIFVGANNSGKSRFLRSVASIESDNIHFQQHVNQYKIFQKVLDESRQKFGDIFFNNDLSKIKSPTDFAKNFSDLFKRIKTAAQQTNGYSRHSTGYTDIEVSKYLLHSFDLYKIGHPDRIDLKRVYVPILRTLRAGMGNHMLRATRADYQFEESGDVEVFSGENLAHDLRKMLLGQKSDRLFINNFQDFLSEEFFQGKDVTIIPDVGNEHIVFEIGNDSDRKIYELGDGIQSLVLATFKLYQNSDEHLLLCIEEPELMMHPSMQRSLMKVFLNKKQFPNLHVFVTTHSNHFLDLISDYPDDVNIFSFQKKGEIFYVENRTNHGDIIDLLGVRNSSVYLANCVIWVEGVTDRMFLQCMLQEFMEDIGFSFTEDFHYAFAEYGGGNIANISFEEKANGSVLSISNKNFVIADNDNSNLKSKKTLRRNHLRNVLGEERFFDGHIEIENLIPYKVWNKLCSSDLVNKSFFVLHSKDNSTAFNKELASKKIGALLKKYLISLRADLENPPKYFLAEDISCVNSKGKRFIMAKIVETIRSMVAEGELRLQDFPEATIDLLNKMKIFVEKNNI